MFRLVNTFFAFFQNFVLTTTTVCGIINVSNDTKGGAQMNNHLNSKREKKHPEYVFVRAYQKKNKFSDDEMGKMLGCSSRTYNDKVLGWKDFSPLEGRELSRIFKVSQDTLFLI